MRVIVDTVVWSLALRRKSQDSREAQTLRALWDAGDAVLLGPVRQELLSGVRDPAQFIRLRDRLRVEPDYPIETLHFEAAAELYNLCRSRGVQGSNVDFLICAVAIHDSLSIYTVDNDFKHFAKHVPVTFFEPPDPD